VRQGSCEFTVSQWFKNDALKVSDMKAKSLAATSLKISDLSLKF
jgi:hypothetical protein